VIVPAVISWIHTARRVRSLEEMVAPEAEWVGPSSGMTVLLALLGHFHIVYVQGYLNRIWERASATPQQAPVVAVAV
jgi:hypothetical protein